MAESRGLSTSQLDSSLRRSQSLASSTTNTTAKQQQDSMRQTQRLLNVLQSHPITRPQSHNLSHSATSPFASSSSSALRATSSGRSSPQPAGAQNFDVLDGFRKELERVRKDVHAWTHSGQMMEQRQAQRMNELYAESARASSLSPPRLSRSTSAASRAPGKTPSGALLSSISAILHSPKLQPKHTSPLRRSAAARASPKKTTGSVVGARERMQQSADAFGLAPRDVQTPFASSSQSASLNGSARQSPLLSASSATSADPHVSQLAARGSSLLSSQSSALNASSSKLQHLLTGLHLWKEARQAELRQTEAGIEARKARSERELVERYERERQQLEERANQELADARRNHTRVVDQHVAELNAAVENEFRKNGGIGDGFQPTLSNGFSSQYSTTSGHSEARSAFLDRSMRLEHLDHISAGGGSDSLSSSLRSRAGTRNALSDEDDDMRESIRAAERRKRLRYAPALSGSETRAQLASSADSAPVKRQTTVQDLLYSSEDEVEEKEDESTRQKNILISRAAYLQRAKQQARLGSSVGANISAARREREAEHLATSYGVSGRSRGRSQSASSKVRSTSAKQRAEARILLESSTDEEEEERDREEAYAKERQKASVRFAESMGRTPTGTTPHSSPAPTRSRRSEKSLASDVFGESDEEDEQGRVDVIASEHRNTLQTQREAQLKSAATAGVSGGRLHTTPAKLARTAEFENGSMTLGGSPAASSARLSLKDRAAIFQQRVQRMQQQATRTNSTTAAASGTSAHVEDE